ncbi:hypothetical protein AMATHDRAFT_191529 [Amanita thiersii Skay4041]|uniref:Glutathione S-transferase n=1 Tax=Amanita thiersii Skay4041 TaxID=703135 RepID=A0A2A9NUX3_9AGAR|nr:hypothetical protein AMATHDRAFT_191529 [Amanita thiersii Skay4041]
MSDSKPSVTLYSAPTPNGFCASIIFEELKAIYPSISYTPVKVNMSQNEQKEPWFLKLNPNGRIPVIVDHTNCDLPIFESSAIALYMVQKYDKDFHLWFDPSSDPTSYGQMLQWTFFTHGGVGPMTGQLAHFVRYATEDIPYAKTRYLDETKRLYGVLETGLQNRDFLAGPGRGKYSVADIKTFTWVGVHERVGIESLGEFPNLKAYLQRCRARDAVQAGYKLLQ